MVIGQKFLPLCLQLHVSLNPPVPDVNLRLILAKVHFASQYHSTDIGDVPEGRKLITL